MSIFVGSKNARGQFLANDGWIRATASNFRQVLESGPVARSGDLRFSECDPASPDERVTDLKKSVYNVLLDKIFAVPPGTFPIPNEDFQALRRLRGKFSYRVSDAVLAELASSHAEADYYLLVSTYDAYSTPGAVTGRVVGVLLGVPLNSPPHYTGALLINARTGSIDWVHAVSTNAGNPREIEGARRRLQAVFRTFRLPVAAAR